MPDLLLTDETISEIWHYFEASDSNDNSWHYRLRILRYIAKAQLAECQKHYGSVKEEIKVETPRQSRT